MALPINNQNKNAHAHTLIYVYIHMARVLPVVVFFLVGLLPVQGWSSFCFTGIFEAM